MEEIRKVAELISLAMTMPTLALCAAVVYVWGPSVTKPNDANAWFVLGVVAGFIGNFLDNLYWLIPWTASYLDLSYTNTLVKIGVFFNIFFRQAMGIFAAYCHLKSAELHINKNIRNVNILLCLSSLFGVFYIGYLTYLHG